MQVFVAPWNVLCYLCCFVVGRITEEHLEQAEETFPGIGDMYWEMKHKPATFLQLVWLYESGQLKSDVDCVTVAASF